jgi:hypothetical protein
MKIIKLSILMLLLATSISCKKTVETIANNSCFDAALKEQSKNLFCTQDCQGVIGCDDKIYCNACEAARQGVRLK